MQAAGIRCSQRLGDLVAQLPSRETGERQAAELVFSDPAFGSVDGAYGAGQNAGPDEIESRYAHLYPRSHPGTTAPRGWTLSEPSMASLRRQLEGPDNRPVLSDIRRWFDAGLRCP